MSQLFALGGQSISFSINPSNEHSVLIFFRIDWFDLLAVQGTLRIFSSPTIQKHQFFCTQPSLWPDSHPYMTTGKSIALTIHTFMAKWCLCFLIHRPGCVTAFLVSIANSSVQGKMGMKSLEYTIETNHTDAGLWRMWSSENGKYF